MFTQNSRTRNCEKLVQNKLDVKDTVGHSPLPAIASAES